MFSETLKSREELYLILGCFGRIDDNFISCASCENRILKIHPGIENYNQLMDYLDTCQLFDKPAFDYNVIKNVLQNIQGRFDQFVTGKRLWSEKELQHFQRFLQVHRTCGLYMKLALIPMEGLIEPEIEEKAIKVPAHSTQVLIEAPKINLRFIRGKR